MDDLIAADDVIGTEVFTAEGRKLGRIETIMVDRLSGKAVYVILAAGGFLGIGSAFYPLPWAKIRYEAALNGYIAEVDEEALLKSPSYDRHGRLDRLPEGAPESPERSVNSVMD
jgi:sporulation protein YlmC with PRC-barrel domain